LQEILITGAGGFIGSAICKIFYENNVPFVGFSRSKRAGYEYVASYLDLPKSKTIIHLAEESSRSLVNKMGRPYIKNSLEITRIAFP
jgi:nucleoside-diphosphate-sugar epimerase